MKKTGRGRGKQGRLEDYTEKRGQEEIEGGEENRQGVLKT